MPVIDAGIDRRRGVPLVVAGGACLSLGGLFIRAMAVADGWQILAYRSLAFCALLLIVIAVRHRGRVGRAFARTGGAGLLIALFLGVGSACYVLALVLTTVANALFILGAGPFVAAFLAWAVLGERVPWRTWAAIVAAALGVAVMVAQGLEAGRLAGSAAALGATVTFGAMVVTLRHARGVDMLPATCLGGAVAGVIGAVMADTLVLPPGDVALALTMGVVQFGGGFLFITMGARHLPAAEVSLLALVEPVLAPIWVWAFVDEVPSLATLIGGAVVLGAVAAQAAVGLARAPVGRT